MTALNGKEMISNSSIFAEKPQTALFDTPKTSISVENTEHYNVHPAIAVDKNSRVYEYIYPSGPAYVDLSETYLEFTAYILKSDGGEMVEGAKVAPIPYLPLTMIQNMTVDINGQRLFESGDCHSYVAYLSGLLNTNEFAKNGWMRAALWSSEETGRTLDSHTDPGFEGRRKRFAKSQKVQCSVPLFQHCFNLQKYWPPMNEIRISIQRHTDDFTLLNWDTGATASTYQLCIENPTIQMRRVFLTPGLNIALNAGLQRQPFVYPMNHVVSKYSVIEKGQTDVSLTVHTSLLPRRMFFFLPNQSSLRGNTNSNPFMLAHHGIQEVVVYAGGKKYPTESYGLLDFDKKQYIPAYIGLLRALGMNTNSTNCTLTPSEFRMGRTIFCVDLSSGDIAANEPNLFSPVQRGSVVVRLKFKKGLSDAVCLVTLSEYATLIKYTASGTIIAENTPS